MNHDELQNILKTWRGLNDRLYLCDEVDVKALLDMEIAGERRLEVLRRLHQRHAAMRTARERAEIIALAKRK